ncbi:MAG: hypothetical protein IKS98_08020 [Lachnospiraceae bacterium]|nr:hypothetical protein [Lachnospiraceae bacterium]
MNDGTLKLYRELLKKGYISQRDSQVLWNYVEDVDIYDELCEMGKVLDFDIIRAQGRIYIVPTENNEIFLKNRMDYRADLKTSEIRNRDLYLFNYFEIYLIYLFFRGENADAQVMTFITRDDLIKTFTEHCKTITSQSIDDDDSTNAYSENFRLLAENWLGKKEGDPASRKIEDRNGIVNRVMIRLKADELFNITESGIIRPTTKLIDLMPYVLRKERVGEINNWFEKEESHATDT